jgi:hypothetical protein
LADKRDELGAKGVEVPISSITTGLSRSISRDPNGLSLEYCCLLRSFTKDDARMQERFTVPVAALELRNATEMNKAKSGRCA